MTGPFSSGKGMPLNEERIGRRYFSLNSYAETIIRHIKCGIVFVLPIIIYFFSRRAAVAILLTEVASYYTGMLITEFNYWYNNTKVEPEDLKLEEPKIPPSELEAILERLEYFVREGPFNRLDDMFRYLDNDTMPFGMDNLDWLEIVNLLNKLSLHVGNRFEENKKE